MAVGLAVGTSVVGFGVGFCTNESKIRDEKLLSNKSLASEPIQISLILTPVGLLVGWLVGLDVGVPVGYLHDNV